MDRKPKFTVIYDLNQSAFETSVNAHLNEGYKILSTSSGVVDRPETYYSWFQAVMECPAEPIKAQDEKTKSYYRIPFTPDTIYPWGLFTAYGVLSLTLDLIDICAKFIAYLF